jgi:hypothetical protein
VQPPHRIVLGAAQPGERGVALLVEVPAATGRHPAAVDALDRPVDVEHLQQQLQAGPPDVHVPFEGRHGHRLGGVQRVEDRLGLGARRDAGEVEVVPDRLVDAGRHEDDIGLVDRPPGAADLLVVGDR